MKKEKIGMILIIIAAVLWGTMGIFVRHMETYGFSSMQIVCVRLTTAALCFMVLLIVKDRQGFTKAIKNLPIFLATGILSLLFFTWCYFTAISMMDVSIAAILLYTSPIWVMIMSIVFLKEKITKNKVVALVLAFVGCVLVSGIATGGKITAVGLFVGIGAGIGYGLYSIFGAIALKKHSTYALTAFSFTVAAIGAWLLAKPMDMIQIYKQHSISLIGFTMIMGVVTAFIPFLCYTLGLTHVVASKAAILATIEPMVATLVGVFVFNEKLSVISFIGIVCILGAVIVLSKVKKE